MNQLAVGQKRVYVVEQFVGEPEFQSVQASRLGYHTAYVGVSGVTPAGSSSAAGVAQQFTVHYTNPYGSSDISLGQVVFNADPNGLNASGACQMQWDNYGDLTLMAPSGSQYGVMGRAGILSNAYCSVDAGSSSLTATGAGYDVSVKVTFTSQFSQTFGSTSHQIWAFGQNTEGLVGSWVDVGAWMQTSTLPNFTGRNGRAVTPPLFVYNDNVQVRYTNGSCPFDCRALTYCDAGADVTATPTNMSVNSWDLYITADTNAVAGTRTFTCYATFSGFSEAFDFTLGVYDATPAITSVTHFSDGNPVFTQGEGQAAVRMIGRNFGTSGQLSVSGTGVSVGQVTWWSSNEIDVYFNIDMTAIGSYLISVNAATGDSGNSFQSRPGDPQSQRIGNGQFTVNSASLTVTVNGTQIHQDDTVLVNPANPPLNIVATLLSATGNVTWQLHGQYQASGDSAGYDEFYPFGLLQPVAAATPFTVTQSIGGTLYILWNLNGGGTNSFRFFVKGTTLARADILSYLGTTPWFLPQIAGAESGFRQFAANGNPLFGPPHGYGLMQIDPAPNLATLYDWHINADAGRGVVQGFFAGADAFWRLQLTTWADYNAANPATQFALPGDDTEANCTFSAVDPPPGGAHSFRDAVWIKRYNAGTLPRAQDNFISWVDSVGWSFNRVNAQGVNYVANVCGITP